MKILTGELTSNGTVLKQLHKEFNDNRDFFIAYVDMCYDLDISVPFWTTVQEMALDRKGKVVFKIDGSKELTVTIKDNANNSEQHLH
jgi:hypothetical protein